MTHLDCCRFRQVSSNDLPNTRVVQQLSEEQPTYPSLNTTPTSSRSADDLQPICEIFASSNLESFLPEHLHIADGDFGPKRAMLFGIRSKESTGRLHEIFRVLRRSISRDSESSKQNSSKKPVCSEEDLKRRKELKRALHRRLEEELLQDRPGSENGYDADAVPIKTPNGSWVRNGGLIQTQLSQPRGTVDRFEPSSSLQGREIIQQTHGVIDEGHRQVSNEWKSHNSVDYDQVQDLAKASRTNLIDSLQFSLEPRNQLQATTLQLCDSNAVQPPGRLDQHSNVISHEKNFQSRSSSNLHVSRSVIFSETVPRPDRSHPTPGNAKLHHSRSMCFAEKAPQQESGRSGLGIRRRSIQQLARIPSSILPSRRKSLELCDSSRPPRKRIWGLSGHSNQSTDRSIQHNEMKSDGNSVHELPSDARIKVADISSFDDVLERMSTNDRVQSDPTEARRSLSKISEIPSVGHLQGVLIAKDAVSKPLLSSASLSQLDGPAQTLQTSSSDEKFLLHPVKTRLERRNSSSGLTHLKVPETLVYPRRDIASSNYSSYNDSLASSRHSSLMKIRSLSERLEYLKMRNPNDEQDQAAWSTVLDIPRVSATQILTVETNEARRRTSDCERPPADAPGFLDFGSGDDSAKKSFPTDLETTFRPLNAKVDPGVRADSRQQRSYSREHKGLRRPSLYDSGGSDEWYSSGNRQGHGLDFATPADEDASSIWERALQDHAKEDFVLSKKRVGSVSPACSRRSLPGRTDEGKPQNSRPPLQRGAQYLSSDSWKVHSQAAYGADLHLSIPMTKLRPGKRVVVPASDLSSPIPSWSRFPSHSRAERSLSPAGKADNVTPRDFATEFRSLESMNVQKEGRSFHFGRKKKNRSLRFGKSMMNTLGRIYNIDFRRLSRGHRSSISVGGKLEYPELEILPQLPPPLQPLGAMSKSDIATVLDTLHQSSSQPSIVRTNKPDTDDQVNGARIWSKLYEDCVQHPIEVEEASIVDKSSPVLHPHPVSGYTLQEETSDLSPQSSAQMHISTLDFHKTLLDHEVKAKKRAMQSAYDAWGGVPLPA